MTVEKVLSVGELHVKEIQLDANRTNTGGVEFKDDQGFVVLRIDPNGNIHTRGGILKDL